MYMFSMYFQLKKLQEKLKKCQVDVEATQEKYNACLTDLNGYNSKYIEEMTEVGSPNTSRVAMITLLSYCGQKLRHTCRDSPH